MEPFTKYFSISQSIPTTNKGHVTLQEKLHQIGDIFNQAKLSFFLVYGTCLGAVREKNIIPHDDDIDLGFYEEDAPLLATLIDQLEEQGFYIEEICPTNLRVILKDCPYILDLWVIKKVTNPIYRLMGHKWWVANALSRQDYFNKHHVNMAECDGQHYRIPAKEISYLEELFGPTWHIPQEGACSYYRPFLSQCLHFLFFNSDMPLKYSGGEDNNTFKPWASWILKRYFPKARVTHRFKHPSTTI